MLEIQDLRAGYGAINVLWGISLNVPKGEVTTILGPNGAGKTTLLRAIMGLIPAGHGEIRLNGESLRGISTSQLAERGVAMIPEGRMIFKDLSVEENLQIGAYPPAVRGRCRQNLERSYATFPRLKERRRQAAGSLSGGEAQMLALARGLMADPHTILIDEPSLGLAPVIVQEIFDILQGLKASGQTVVLVEQNTRMALKLADNVYLLQGGRVQLSRPAAEVDLDELHDLYFAR